MSQHAGTPSSTLDTLPKQFVNSMRTLFDIMDDKHTGFVQFADIERRWQDDGTKGLPKGVIESLQKVTPPNGLLSFERFCAGLKICLLRNQVESNRNSHQTVTKQRSTDLNGSGGGSTQPIRPPSAPLLDIECASSKPPWPSATSVHHNNVLPQQRALSMPQLLTERKDSNSDNLPEPTKPIPNINNKQTLYGPPKPPRSALGLEQRNLDRAEIRTALQNWQMGLMMNTQEQEAKVADAMRVQTQGFNARVGRGSGDGKPAAQVEMQVGLYQKKANVRRREPRRHTLQNGIDYSMLKRMKQIEQEKDVLMQGLAAIEKTREWYLKQVATVQDKMKYLGRVGSHMEAWSEAQQERLELQRARVFEVNRQLATLTDSWERGGLPLHMNLAVCAAPSGLALAHPHSTGPPALVARLKQQNHLLTEEVSKKSERIAVLEKEKAALIRELLQTRAVTARPQPPPPPANVVPPGQEEAVF